MSIDYFLVCDETKLYCAIANECVGVAGDSGRTERGKYAFVISHAGHDLQVLTAAGLEDLKLKDPRFVDWEKLRDPEEIIWTIDSTDAAELREKGFLGD